MATIKSIKEKAKRYDEVVEKAKNCLKDGTITNTAISYIETIFPELKESEDERIRKVLKEYFINSFQINGVAAICGVHIKDIIAWLEKQGNKVIDCSQNHKDMNNPNGCIVLEDFNGGDGFYKVHLDYLNKKQVEEVEEMVRAWNKESNTSDENIKSCIGICLTDADEQRFKDFGTNLKECRDWLERKGEQKSQGKLEDDVRRRSTIQVLEYARSLDTYNQYGKADIDKNIAWLEKQGEKPQGKTALEAINEEKVDNANKVEPRQEELTEFEKAVKQVMEEAIECGDTRNLKADADMLLSLAHNSSWSEEDKKMFLDIECLIHSYRTGSYEYELSSWLEHLKDRVQPQPKREWSEEDEYCRHQLIAFCENCMAQDACSKRCAHWLKSLKERYTWKPSDEQMKAQ